MAPLPSNRWPCNCQMSFRSLHMDFHSSRYPESVKQLGGLLACGLSVVNRALVSLPSPSRLLSMLRERHQHSITISMALDTSGCAIVLGASPEEISKHVESLLKGFISERLSIPYRMTLPE